MDDRDLRLVERRVELVELCRVQLELVERERDVVGVEGSALKPGLEQPLGFVGREDVRDRRFSVGSLRFACGQRAPLPRQRITP